MSIIQFPDRPKLVINPNRIDLDEAYLRMAEVWAMRSKANRLQVGAILVRDGQIISDGYNGMPSGAEGDDDVCEIYNADGTISSKPEVLHAEANAILKCACHGGVGCRGATLYSKIAPCPPCANLAIQAKLARVVFREHYRLPEGIERLMKRGIECVHLPHPESADA